MPNQTSPRRFFLWYVSLSLASGAAVAGSPRHLTLDQPQAAEWTIHGRAETVSGVKDGALQLDGGSVIEVKDAASLRVDEAGLTFTIWCNPFLVRDDQRMIAAKNRYGQGEREWGVMLDRDGKFRLYVWQGRWKTVESAASPKPGHWHQVGVVLRNDRAELWVDGLREGSAALDSPVAPTAAPITLGGVLDGSPRQAWFGALDEFRLFDEALSDADLAALYEPVTATLKIPPTPLPSVVQADPFWTRHGAEDARQDRSVTLFKGRSPDKLACDTTLRRMPDGSWVHVMLGGGDKEPDPRNGVFLQRSLDEGATWSALERLDFGFPKDGDTRALVPTELMVHEGRCTLYFATHDGTFGGWKSWSVTSEDSCKSWGQPQPLPGRLHDRTFIRNHIVTRDGRLLLPFQHYEDAPRSAPVNGVLISTDGGQTWSEHGNIRLTENRAYQGWAENNIVELLDGRIAMIIRADG
ncbi:MAG: exo-alpha-sialidase, partial [Verrucomicrobiales bacterium]|nr:exo-alpha-sialidase [Verrucomicrobiales bacterium]